ncbi:hypothetical protein BDW66DRAFT_16822 [Aspergillus desertorum]
MSISLPTSTIPIMRRRIRINVDLLRRAVTAVDNLSHKLAVVVLPTEVKVDSTVYPYYCH